jgi:hypothetical protein
MTTASIYITKKITVIKGCIVTEHDMNEFTNIIQNLQCFDIKGDSKPAKLNKYVNLALQNGFVKSAETIKNAGFEGKNSDVLSYKITFTK